MGTCKNAVEKSPIFTGYPFRAARASKTRKLDAEGVGELAEIGVLKIRGDQAVAVVLLLDALHLAWLVWIR